MTTTMPLDTFWVAYLYLMGGVLMFLMLEFMNRIHGQTDQKIHVAGALFWPIIVPIWMIVLLVRGPDK